MFVMKSYTIVLILASLHVVSVELTQKRGPQGPEKRDVVEILKEIFGSNDGKAEVKRGPPGEQVGAGLHDKRRPPAEGNIYEEIRNILRGKPDDDGWSEHEHGPEGPHVRQVNEDENILNELRDVLSKGSHDKLVDQVIGYYGRPGPPGGK